MSVPAMATDFDRNFELGGGGGGGDKESYQL